MVKILKVVLFCFIVQCTACTTKVKHSQNIFRLDKLSKVYSNGVEVILNEDVIFENAPLDIQQLDSLMENYINSQSLLFQPDSFSYKKDKIDIFYISFFKRTRCTEYYIHNKEDKKHEIYGDGSGRNKDCSSDCLGFFSYYRSEEDSSMWYCHHPENKKDTIWTCKK